MEDADSTERQFGEIELKLLRAKLLKEIGEILHQISDKGDDFLYPVLDFNSPSDRLIMMSPLVKGEFMGHIYEICTNGMHPTAYVSCGDLATYEKKEEYGELPVHGGCTYTGNRLSTDGLWVGWDYGHYGDFMMDVGRAYPPYIGSALRNGKKWTVAEVMQDVIRAILYIEENK